VSRYRSAHLAHHQHTGTPDDPELQNKAAGAPQWDLPMKPGIIARYLIKDLLGLSASNVKWTPKIGQGGNLVFGLRLGVENEQEFEEI